MAGTKVTCWKPSVRERLKILFRIRKFAKSEQISIPRRFLWFCLWSWGFVECDCNQWQNCQKLQNPPPCARGWYNQYAGMTDGNTSILVSASPPARGGVIWGDHPARFGRLPKALARVGDTNWAKLGGAPCATSSRQLYLTEISCLVLCVFSEC